MEKIYTPIGWKDYPSEDTPINAENLNKMDNAIDAIDDRVVEQGFTMDALGNRVDNLEEVVQNGGGSGDGGGIAFETDPTVPDWAKEPEKPSYTASEVGALPDTTEIPKNTSDLTNDSGYITKAVTDLVNYYKKSETYTQDEVNALVSAIPKFSIQPVDSLPTTDISTTTVYLLKSGDETDNLYTEYIYVNGAWEPLGKQTVDLTGYVKRTELSNYYTIEAIDELINSLYGQIPTKVSQLENDSKFVTSDVTDKLSEEIADYIASGIIVVRDGNTLTIESGGVE